MPEILFTVGRAVAVEVVVLVLILTLVGIVVDELPAIRAALKGRRP